MNCYHLVELNNFVISISEVLNTIRNVILNNNIYKFKHKQINTDNKVHR